MRWGIMGGTFDPIHFGHLRSAQEILEIFSLDRVIFVPSAQPPLKTRSDISPFECREAMVRLAIEGNPSFSCSDMEGRRQGKSYTVDTLLEFVQSGGAGRHLYFILGQDAFLDIRKWREWERLLTLCQFVVMTEPDTDADSLMNEALSPVYASQFRYDRTARGYQGPSGYAVFFRAVTRIDIHSTELRRKVREGLSVQYLLPESVRKYIDDNALYRAS